MLLSLPHQLVIPLHPCNLNSLKCPLVVRIQNALYLSLCTPAAGTRSPVKRITPCLLLPALPACNLLGPFLPFSACFACIMLTCTILIVSCLYMHVITHFARHSAAPFIALSPASLYFYNAGMPSHTSKPVPVRIDAC